MINIFLTNLAAYNAGRLIGNWVKLPCENLDAELEKIGVIPGVTEYFITDYETIQKITINEYDNIYDLNNLAAALEKLEPAQAEILSILLEYEGYTLQEAINNIDNCIIYYGCNDISDVAHYIVDESGILNKLGKLSIYFDYTAYSRDLDINYKFYPVSCGMVEII